MIIFDPTPTGLNIYTGKSEVYSETRLEKVSGLPDNYELPEKRHFAYVLPHSALSFTRPVSFLTPASLPKIQECLVYAPFANSVIYNLLCQHLDNFPDASHILLSETAFYSGMPMTARVYALPEYYYQKGIRRYGGNGLVHLWTWLKISSHQPPYPARVIQVFLGDHCDITAMKNGLPIDNSLGFSSLEGLPSTQSCGDIDPSLVLLLQQNGYPPNEILHMLTNQSGWSALIGKPSRLVDLINESNQANEWIKTMFLNKLLEQIGAAAATLGGLDALVFINENISAVYPLIKQICLALAFTGIKILPNTPAPVQVQTLSPGDSGVELIAVNIQRPRVLFELLQV